jgi:hypothetical protein
MNNYQFRTNWRNQLVLQRLYTTRDRWGDPEHEWRDASATDLKYYYQQLGKLQNCCACQQQRELFESQCA